MIPLAAVVAVAGLPATAVASTSVGRVAARLDLRHVLRGLVQDRTPVRLVAADGRVYVGVLNRCGADFVDLTGASSEREGGRRSWLLSLSGLVTLYVE